MVRPKVRIRNSGGRGAVRRRVTGWMAEKTKVEWAVEAGELRDALAAIVKHWRAGEPVHGQAIEDLMDRAEAALRNRN